MIKKSSNLPVPGARIYANKKGKRENSRLPEPSFLALNDLSNFMKYN
jgi:hypothetical protein